MILCTVSVMLLSSMVAAAAVSSIEDIEKLGEKNISGVKTMTVSFTQSMFMSQNMSVTSKGTMYFMVPNTMKMESVMDMMGQNIKVIVINDGKTLWTETHMGTTISQVQKTDVAALQKLQNQYDMPSMNAQEMSIEQIVSPLRKLHDQYSLTWLGEQTVDDKKLFAVDATITENGKEKFKKLGNIGEMAAAMAGHQRLYFDGTTGFLARMVMLGENNAETMSMSFSGHKLNPDLDAAMFTYTPPPDVNVADMTPMIEQMFSENAAKNAARDTAKDAAAEKK